MRKLLIVLSYAAFIGGAGLFGRMLGYYAMGFWLNALCFTVYFWAGSQFLNAAKDHIKRKYPLTNKGE